MLPEERAKLVATSYDRIAVNGPDLVAATLTPMPTPTGWRSLCPSGSVVNW
jgi:hypothetical protein